MSNRPYRDLSVEQHEQLAKQLAAMRRTWNDMSEILAAIHSPSKSIRAWDRLGRKLFDLDEAIRKERVISFRKLYVSTMGMPDGPEFFAGVRVLDRFRQIEKEANP